MRLWSYTSTSMLTPDFSSTVMWSSQMVICLTQRRINDLVDLCEVGGLLCDVILQVVDSFYLFIPRIKKKVV